MCVLPTHPSGQTPAPVVPAHALASFHQIVLPDLVLIDPKGVPATGLARLGKIHGLRDMLAVDGARISVGASPVNIIGVNPSQYRSWTPLRTATDDPLWASLATGGFVASPAARQGLRLRKGSTYPLSGAATLNLTFGGDAPLGIVGIDLVVGSQQSAKLGLVHNVAVFVSAPGKSMSALKHEVRVAVGHVGTLVSLRQQPLPVDAAGGGRPTTYMQLFRASAALYCPGLSWTVLAAIGQIESADGTNMGPSTAGALGPMQFLPSTWAAWGITAFGESGPPNIMDPYDAVPSAARYLCANGAGTPAGLPGAIFAYNHAQWYVNEVLALAQQYARLDG